MCFPWGMSPGGADGERGLQPLELPSKAPLAVAGAWRSCHCYLTRLTCAQGPSP